MLIAGYYAKRFGNVFDAYRRRRRATVLCWNADGSYGLLLALQLLNAIYIGIPPELACSISVI